MPASDAIFAGSVPAIYDRYLRPLLFEPYAADLAARIAKARPHRLLETAAGTGVVTEAMRQALPDAAITATDLNPGMLEVARARAALLGVEVEVADAQALSFPDASFDVVACQFGVMFFPNRPRAYREATRVLAPGGRFIFNVWNRLSENPLSNWAARAVAELFPANPPSFFERVPFGYHDQAQIEGELRASGFREVGVTTVEKHGRVRSAADAALGLCQGTPLRAEIENRAPDSLDEVTAAVAAALAQRFGTGAFVAPMSAHVVCAAA